MSFNDLYSSFEKFDNINRQMATMDKWNNIAEMNERIERFVNPLGKHWAVMEKFDTLNRQLEAIDKWNSISNINQDIERLMYPLGKHWADMEKFERSQHSWSKSIAALSPTINTTYDHFSKLEELINPPGFAAYQKMQEIEKSINRMSSIMTATAAFEKHHLFIERFTWLNDLASGLAANVVEETITIDNFESSLSGLHEKIDALRNDLKEERNAKDLLKLFDRWISIIGIIVGLLSIYYTSLSMQANVSSMPASALSASQQDTLKALREFIAPSGTKRIWITNRKCRIHAKPSRTSIVIDSISATSAVDVIVLRQKWACVSYYVDDSTYQTGWVDKNYLDTLKGIRRPGNHSPFK
jgi:hypothetical protein